MARGLLEKVHYDKAHVVIGLAIRSRAHVIERDRLHCFAGVFACLAIELEDLRGLVLLDAMLGFVVGWVVGEPEGLVSRVEPSAFGVGEVLDQREQRSTGRDHRAPQLFLGQALADSEHRLAIVIEEAEEYFPLVTGNERSISPLHDAHATQRQAALCRGS